MIFSSSLQLFALVYILYVGYQTKYCINFVYMYTLYEPCEKKHATLSIDDIETYCCRFETTQHSYCSKLHEGELRQKVISRFRK